MKMAFKKIDVKKIDELEVVKKFEARYVDLIEYHTKLAEQLNEVVFEFNIIHEAAFLAYLKERNITGRVFR